MEIYEQRKANLQALIKDKYGGTIKGLSDAVGVSHNTIWRLVSDTKHGRNIGEDLARRIEAATGVPSGYLDLSSQSQDDAVAREMSERILALPKRNREAMLEMLELIERGNSSE